MYVQEYTVMYLYMYIVLTSVFYIEPVRRPQADNFQPGLATVLLAGPTGRQLCV